MMDPREVLGVSPNAGEEEIRAAYLRKVKEFPPDRAPEEFERIRNAFETLGDPRKRALAMLQDSGYGVPLPSLLDGKPARRLYAGPQVWREALKAR
jgi:curved DNA-binding protein CbpA